MSGVDNNTVSNGVFKNEYSDKFNSKVDNRQAGSFKELQRMTPDECNLAFEDDISLTFFTSVLEVADDVLNFFSFGLWGFFFNMREAYAHGTLSALSGAQTYLNCYVPNSLVYNTEPLKSTDQLDIDDLIEKKKFKIIMEDLMDSINIY